MPQPTTDTAGRLGRLGRLTLKELREILRDRRTILTLVLMPLLLYPVLSIAFQQFFLSQLSAADEPVYSIGFRNTAEGNYLLFLMNQGGLSFVGVTGTDKPGAQRFNVQVEEQPEDAVKSGQVDVVLRGLGDFQGGFDPRSDLAVDLELLYREDSAASVAAAGQVEEALRKAGEIFLANRLKTLNLTQRTPAILTQRRSLTQLSSVAGTVSLAAVVPLILTLMTVTGAVYPAIDLTAGERERGTLEILVAAPIPRIGVLFAKYIAVLVVALLTAAANLLMMTVTIQASGLGRRLFGEGGLSGTNIAAVFALLLLFAAFYSAVLLVVTCTARSFKEAQAYLIPLMLLSLAPGLLCLMPNVELRGLFLVTPLANIVLLGRDLLTQKATAGAALAVVGSTALYASAAIGIAARIFGAESVLYSTSSGWSDLWQRSRDPRSAPSLTSAIVAVAMIFPLFFLLQGMGGWFASVVEKLLVGGAVTAVVFGCIPAFLCWLRRVSIAPWYTRLPGLAVWLGAVLLGVSLWALDHEVIVAVARARQIDFGSLLELLKAYAGGLRQVPAVLVVLLLAVVPAVFEEFFFRGFLWSAVEREKGWRIAWFTTSVVFGLFHLVMPNPLAVERLIATTSMGFVLGWVRHRSGSVLPGTLLHLLHNATATLISYYSTRLVGAGLDQNPSEHLPGLWLAVAAALSATGLGLVTLSGRRSEPTNPRADAGTLPEALR